jgi:hypothetical protein
MLSTEASAVEKELFNIFSYYSILVNYKTPLRINKNGLYRCCRDSLLFDSTMTEKPLLQVDMELIFKTELKSINQNMGQSSEYSLFKNDKINFNQFVNCLVKISGKCYRNVSYPEKSFHQLLLDNILPHAKRRIIEIYSVSLVQKIDVNNVMKYYEYPLRGKRFSPSVAIIG